MKKQILKQTKIICAVCLLVVFLMGVKSQSSVMAVVAPAPGGGGTGPVKTPAPAPAPEIPTNYANESYCYDALTAQTYQCGTATECTSGYTTCSTAVCTTDCSAFDGAIMSNWIASDYVVEPPNYNISTPIVVSNTPYFPFNIKECYVFDNPPSGKYTSTDAWIGGPCTSANKNLDVEIPDISSSNSKTILQIIKTFAATTAAKKSGQVTTIPDQQLPGASDGGIACTNNVNQSQNSAGQNCSITAEFIDPLIVFLSALVGIVVTASIIIGGIQYSAAGDNPQAVAAARKRIFNAILALLIYGLLYGFLNFIIPGGI